MPQRAVLLVNLGSPDSTSVADVRRYLEEFLGDERVIDRPGSRFLRSILLNRIIIPRRAPKSAHAYAQIWTKEGSPLIAISRSVQKKLAAALGPATPVYLAMRYGTPSVASILAQMESDGIEEALLFPQYPHYAMSSWETVVVKVYEEATLHAPRLRITSAQPFYKDADYIEALCTVAAPFLAQPHDYVLFSYHGIPVRHLRKADSSKAHCMVLNDCCSTCSPVQATCYRSQCFATTRALVARAGLTPDRHSVSFQSRLVGEPWLTPYTDHELDRLAKAGVKRILILCPAFVADCLETIEEISGEGKQTFIQAGGESFTQIPCLNDHPAYIDFLAKRSQYWITSCRV
ncbi:MAG: ferrochelatase [Opitutus sp.]